MPTGIEYEFLSKLLEHGVSIVILIVVLRHCWKEKGIKDEIIENRNSQIINLTDKVINSNNKISDALEVFSKNVIK